MTAWQYPFRNGENDDHHYRRHPDPQRPWQAEREAARFCDVSAWTLIAETVSGAGHFDRPVDSHQLIRTS